MGKIIEIADVQVFRKCCPRPCHYCKYIIDLCGWSKSTCPNCGIDLESIPLNLKLYDDISSDDENIRT